MSQVVGSRDPTDKIGVFGAFNCGVMMIKVTATTRRMFRDWRALFDPEPWTKRPVAQAAKIKNKLGVRNWKHVDLGESSTGDDSTAFYGIPHKAFRRPKTVTGPTIWRLLRPTLVGPSCQAR
jgi:hypothetical protein